MKRVKMFFINNFTKQPAEKERTGLGRWFQVIEESFFKLFYANLFGALMLTPFFIFLLLAFNNRSWEIFLCSLALLVFPGSPAIGAVNFVCQQTVCDMPVWTINDFWDSFKKKLWKSIIIASILIAFWGVLFYAIFIVIAVDGGLHLHILAPLISYIFLLTGFTYFSILQTSIVDLPIHIILRNSVHLIFAGKIRSVTCIFFWMITGYVVAKWNIISIPFIYIGVPSIFIVTQDLIFYKVFKQYFNRGGNNLLGI